MVGTKEFEKQEWVGWALHAVGIGVSLAGIMLAYCFVIHPMQTEATRLDDLAADCARFVPNAKHIQSENSTLNRELSNRNRQLTTMMERIPIAPHESEFLGQLATVAKETGVSIHDFRPGETLKKETHNELEVRLSADGDYESICHFLEEIENLSRMFRITRLEIQAPSAFGETHPISMTFRIYFASMPGSPSDASEKTDA